MARKRVLVVDDSSMYQRLLSDVINSHPQLEVVGVAVNGREALELIDTLKPHVVTLDILMPQMDGIQTLIELRRSWPEVRAVMVSSLTSEGSDAALDALTLGAHEYAAKPVSAGGVSSIRAALTQDLLPKIEALCNLDSVSDTAVPEAIVQHMPAEFTAKLAARLDSASALAVREAQAGDRLQAGTVYIAPGNYHMVLEREGVEDVIRLNQNPLENSCRPSVDPLFRSAAAIHGSRCLGIVMTGMGQDGLKGSEVMYAAGASILVQDEASSVVWGMPKLVAQAGLAEAQVSLERMPKVIIERIMGSGRAGVQQVGSVLDTAAKASSHQRPGSGGMGS